MKSQLDGIDGMELMERAIHLLRAQPSAVWVVQAAGAVPLLLAVLYLLLEASSDIQQPALTASRSLLCAVCLLWFNICRSRFAQLLMSSLTGEVRGSWAAAASPVHLVLQSIRLFLLPAAFAAVIPWARAVAFFRTIPLFNGPGSLARVLRISAIWPRQNWIVLGLASLLAAVVFVNVLVSILMLPGLLRTFTGIEDEFTRASGSPINTATLGIAVALTWFALDPLYQAIFAVRCFLGEARGTGADLRLAIRRLTVLGLLILSFHPSLSAQGELINAAELRESVHQTLKQSRYSWHDRSEPAIADNFLTRSARKLRNGITTLGNRIGDFTRWLFQSRSSRILEKKTAPRAPAATWTLVVLVFALAGITGFGLIRLVRARPTPLALPLPAERPPDADVESENVTAADLPEDRWLELARECLLRGECRPALRAFYLANLSYLAQRDLLTITRYKSNADYAREVRRRARNPSLDQAFTANVRSFERGWYGMHPVAADQIAEFEAAFQEMKTYAGV